MRAESLQQLTTGTFDVLVIGGGATGSSVALHGAHAGLKVGLLQSRDFSSGASSNYPTCLLLHGGIGYRENGYSMFNSSQFLLAKDAQGERKKYVSFASRYLTPYSIFVPIRSHFISFLYSFASKLFPRRLRFQWSIWSSKFPFLAGYAGTAIYSDHFQSNSKLNLSFIRKSISKGATCLNYARVDSLERKDDKTINVTFTDIITKRKYLLNTKIIVNATGSQCDAVRKLLPSENQNETKETLSAAKMGFHMILNQPKLPKNTAIIHPRSDGSVVFLAFYRGFTLAGIEDWNEPFDEELGKHTIINVLDVLNQYWNDSTLCIDDVQSAWTTWRPLMNGGTSARDFIIDTSIDGLISVTGGAWSETRLMGDEVIQQLLVKYKRTSPITHTTVVGYDSIIHINDGSQDGSGLPQRVVEEYPVDLLLRLCEEDNSLFEKIIEGSEYDFIKAEVVYAVRYDFAVKIADFLFRRVDIGFIHPEQALLFVSEVGNIMSSYLKWTEEQVEEEKQEARNLLHKKIVK